MTLKNNLRTLWNDVSFNRSVKMLGVVMVAAIVLFFFLWLLGVGIKAEVCQGPSGGRHPMSFLEYAFCVLGAIDGNPEVQPVDAVYSVVVRLAGAILIGGVITSFLCTLLDRYSDMTQRGLMYRKLSGHTIIVGYGKNTDDFIRRTLKDEEDFECWFPDRLRSGKRGASSGKVLLYTSDDVIRVRESLSNLLPKELVSKIEFVSGEMDLSNKRNSICKRMCLKDARRVFVLGDHVDSGAGELRNLNFAMAMAGYLRSRRDDVLPFPIYVQMEDSPSFDVVKKMDYGFDSKKVMLIPFSFSEGWARAIWGSPDSKYEPLQFRPMGDGDYVHLVVGGLTSFGRALAIQAIRVAHYVKGERTRITLVDPDRSQWQRFSLAYPGLSLLPDMEISYVQGDLRSDAVRAMISAEAKSPHSLLTIAVCDDSQDMALETALNLPREVYPDSASFPSSDTTRILVRQDHGGGNREGRGLERFPPKKGRYEYVQPFGWQELGVPTWSLQRLPVLVGLWFFKHKDWEERLGNCQMENVDFQEMRREAFELYKGSVLSLLWANVYTADSITTVLRQLGLKAVRSRGEGDSKRDIGASLSLIKELKGSRLRDFARAEHNRWMADRVLMGYQQHPKQPTKDNEYRWHNCLVDFNELPEENVRKDESSVKGCIYTLAMMGYHIEPIA